MRPSRLLGLRPFFRARCQSEYAEFYTSRPGPGLNEAQHLSSLRFFLVTVEYGTNNLFHTNCLQLCHEALTSVWSLAAQVSSGVRHKGTLRC